MTQPLPDAGGACTPRAEAGTWPVKVLFVVQRSASMCLADPGAMGESGTLCDAFSSSVAATRSARVRELLGFLDANANRTELQVGLVTWKANPTLAPFEPVASPALRARVLGLEAQLGSPGNLQGALEGARALLEQDLSATPQAVRARTRYVVVLVGNGLVGLRCSANDALTTWAAPSMPDLIWHDFDRRPGPSGGVDAGVADGGAECLGPQCGPPGGATWCNADPSMFAPDERVMGFAGGGDLNQNAQHWAAVTALTGLRARFDVADLSVHARLVFSDTAFTRCGPICADALGGLSPAELRTVAGFTYGGIAQRGGGTFVNAVEPAAFRLQGFATEALTTFCGP